MIDYITSLPLLPPKSFRSDEQSQSEDEDDHSTNQEEQAGQVMRDTIDFLNEVDRAWRTVLRGQAWVIDPSKSSDSGRAVRVDYAGTVGQTERSFLPFRDLI
jgi:hypothetical protein